jgi:hypothetical protein
MSAISKAKRRIGRNDCASASHLTQRDESHRQDSPADEDSPVGEVRRTLCAKVHTKGTETDIRALMEHTDTVAEIQNTLRVETVVRLSRFEIASG